MTKKYMGIENEFYSFRYGFTVPFGPGYFSKVTRNPTCFFKNRRSVRTSTGNGYYIDQSEIEILTPPVAMNKGFATRLIDSLMIGRDHLAASTPRVQHTGYSMHWNITKGTADHSSLLKGIFLPFSLFGLTPLSTGMAVRDKGHPRYELMGDSLCDEDQLRATALLIGAYAHAIDRSETPKIELASDSHNKLTFPDGRYQTVFANIPGANIKNKEMQAHEYLQLFYEWIEPYARALGTPHERENLEDFITGIKPLEFDRFKYFSYLRDEEGKTKGVYLPLRTKDELNPGQLLQSSGKERKLPLEAALLGGLVEQRKGDIVGMDWAEVYINTTEGMKTVSGIADIYQYASSLDDTLPKFRLPFKLDHIKQSTLARYTPRKPIEYNEDNDHFFDDRRPESFSTIYLAEAKAWWRKYAGLQSDIPGLKLLIPLVSALGLAFVAYFSTSILESHDKAVKVDTIIESTNRGSKK